MGFDFLGLFVGEEGGEWLGSLVDEERGKGLSLLDLAAEERGRLKTPWRRRYREEEDIFDRNKTRFGVWR